MAPDRPLRFTPLFRSYIWGGERLQKVLGKKVPGPGDWAESWEIVDHGEDQSVVAIGDWQGITLRQLVDTYPDEILGNEIGIDFFPLLLKYLDCNRVLSVQVHPDDAYGLRMETPDLGKTEAWYIVHAEPGAKVYAGLKEGIDRETLAKLIDAGKTEEALHVITPSAGDCIFIPAGTVHALGEGLLVTEIQQASDTTFRLYDWDRVDADGNSRPLHIEQALDVIDYKSGAVSICKPSPETSQGLSRLVDCDKFVLDRMVRHGSYETPSDEQFRIVTIPSGSAILEYDGELMMLGAGETALVPALHVPVTLYLNEDSVALLAALPKRTINSQ